MKVLIQHRCNLLYWDGGQWVNNPDQAQNFVTSTAAIDHAHSQKLDNVQIVLKFSNPAYDLTLPFQNPDQKRPHA